MRTLSTCADTTANMVVANVLSLGGNQTADNLEQALLSSKNGNDVTNWPVISIQNEL